MSATTLPPLTGGRFLTGRELGRGGIGIVFDALDDELDRPVAVKRMRPDRADDATARERFQREARVTGRLDHPGVVPVYGCGADGDGRPYYAMRRIPGRTLRRAIQDYYASPSRDRAEFRRLLGQFVAVCQTMAYAHSQGVIHRDLKPDNIMLGDYGETLVVDWGLAKQTSNTPPAPMTAIDTTPALVAAEPTGDTDLTVAYLDETPVAGESGATAAGTVMGTFGYMAPEQAAGAPVSLAADIYSLGATLFHLLTGHAAKPGRGLSSADARQLRPRPLAAIVRKAMAVDPAARYSSAKDMADDVERWLAGERVWADREPLRERIGRWLRRHPTTTAVTVLLLLATAVAVPTWRSARERDRIRRATQAATEASELRTRGQWPAAVAKLDEALALGHPDPVRIRLDRYRYLATLSRLDEAERELASLAGDTGPHAGEVLLWQGDEQIAVNRLAEGRDLIRQALALGVPGPLQAYGESLLAPTAAAAEIKLREAVTLDPYLVEPQRHLVFLLLVSGKWDEFERHSGFAAERFPEDAGFAMMRALGFGLHGNNTGAEFELTRLKDRFDEKALKFVEFVVRRCLVLSRYMDEWPSPSLVMNLALGELATALIKQVSPSADGAVSSRLQVPPSVRQTVDINSSRLTAASANPGMAVDLLKEFTAVYPDAIFTLLRAMMADRESEAEKMYRQASQGQSTLPNVQREALTGAAYSAVSTFLDGSDDKGFARAGEYLRQRLALGPLRDMHADFAVKLLYPLRLTTEMRLVVDDQIKRHPGDMRWLRELALIHLWEGRWPDAVAAIDQVLAKDPKDEGMRIGRTEAILAAELFVAGTKEPTAEMVRRALGEPVEATIRRADALAASGNPRHAARNAAQLYALAASAQRGDAAARDQLLDKAMVQLRRLVGVRMFKMDKKSFTRVHGFHLLEARADYHAIIAEK